MGRLVRIRIGLADGGRRRTLGRSVCVDEGETEADLLAFGPFDGYSVVRTVAYRGSPLVPGGHLYVLRAPAR